MARFGFGFPPLFGFWTMTMAMATLVHRWRWTAPAIGNYYTSTRRLRCLQCPETTNWSRRSQFSSTTASNDDRSTQLPQSQLLQTIPEHGFSRILTDDQRMLFHQVNELSSLSKSLAKQVGSVAVKEDSLLVDIARLQSHRRQRLNLYQSVLESTNVSTQPSLFTVVFAGEFNSGKSTLINALLGSELVETGVLPTTDKITIIMADGGDGDGDADSNENDSTASVLGEIRSTHDAENTTTPAHTHLHILPASKFPILSDLCLIDTPGTNAILSLQHTNLTLRILHDADLIIFVTSADRPFSESEQNLLRTSIKSYRKRVVLVINKMDVLERQKGEDHGDTTKKKVVEYVVEHAGDLLGARPVVIPLSARDALSMKLLYSSHGTANDIADGRDYQSSLWNRSNLAELEQFLLKTLTVTSKVKTKLLNPIGVAEGILVDCQQEIRRRQEELEVDVMTLRLLSNQTDAWERDLQSEVIDKCRLNIREVMEDRAEIAMRVIDELSYFEQWKLSLGLGSSTFDRTWAEAKQRGRVMLISKSQDGFAPKHTLEDDLLSIVREFMTNLTSRATKQGIDSLEYLGKRPVILGTTNVGRKGSSRMVGSVRTPSFRRLKGLESSIIDVIHKSISEFPSDDKMSAPVYASLCRTAVLSNLLVVGGVTTAVLSAWDMVAATSGATMSVFGVMMIPLSNRYIASSFKREWMLNATRLETSLEILLKDACNQVRSELSESISPYSRYVDSETKWLKELSDKLDSAISTSHSLRSKINKACQ